MTRLASLFNFRDFVNPLQHWQEREGLQQDRNNEIILCQRRIARQTASHVHVTKTTTNSNFTKRIKKNKLKKLKTKDDSNWIWSTSQLFIDILGSLKPNAEWCVMEFPVKKNVLFYACCEEPYVDLTYILRIERKPLSYVFNLILPCICITVLTVLSFCLPPESGITLL